MLQSKVKQGEGDKKRDWGNVLLLTGWSGKVSRTEQENSSSGEQSQVGILGKGWMVERGRGRGGGRSMED